MQKGIVWILAGTAVLLAAANLLTLRAYLEENSKRADLAEKWAESARELRDCREGPSSIGSQAGFAVGKLQAQSQDSYQILNEQAAKTSEELQKIASEAMVVINEQAAKTGKDLETATDELLVTLNRELEKFRESMNKKTSPNP